jgi:hypothetical protein
MMIIALAVSIPVVVVALVGSIIDAAGSSYFKTFACINSDMQLSGYSNLYANATYCYNKKVGFNNYTSNPNPTTYNCYCSDNSNNCLYLNTKFQSRCNLIFSRYSPTLTAGSIFDFLAFLSILTFSIITCCSVCCPQNFRENYAMDPYYSGGSNPNSGPIVYGGAHPTAVATVGKQPVVYGTVVSPHDGSTGSQTEIYGKPIQPTPAYTATSSNGNGAIVYGNVVHPPPGGIRY